MSQIMIVDDEPVTCRTVAKLMQSEGYDSVCAVGGQVALDLLNGAARPVAMVLDLMMPGVSGWDVLSELRTLPPSERVAVIVYSAQDAQEVESAALAAGADAFVLKGTGWQQLIYEVRKVLGA